MIKILQGDAIEQMKTLPNESVDCIVTSPPYWSCRDYDIEGQLGLENTFQDYIQKLCNIFSESKKTLKSNGCLFVNIGDVYAGGMRDINGVDISRLHSKESKRKMKDYPTKSLCMIPFRFAIEMVNQGWLLRNTIIWYKRNSMPSSAKDRFTVDFEYIFFFTKNQKYYFEQQFEPYLSPLNRWGGDDLIANGESKWEKGTGQKFYRNRNMRPNPEGRNMRCVWNMKTVPYSGEHCAVFPPELPRRCIKAGCPPGGTVLDPFGGSGTTGMVSEEEGRNSILIELNPAYCKIASRRTQQQGLFCK